jgi:3-hydroxyacyl-CoA dehydrogenase
VELVGPHHDRDAVRLPHTSRTLSDRTILFNPPHMVLLVEVVGGAKTSLEAIQRAIEFYASIGKKPIHLRQEVVGHVANRLQTAI